MAYLMAFRTQSSFPLAQGQMLLGRRSIGTLGPVFGPHATFSSAVPSDSSLCGLHLTTQALHFGQVTPFALSNAMDLVIGQ